MGKLIKGNWRDIWYHTRSSGGRFVRDRSRFHGWITPSGQALEGSGEAFPAERGRYHLYVSYACPWAHRALIYRAVKGLEAMVSLSVVHYHMGEDGWSFAPAEGVIPDPVLGARFLHQLYTHADPDYTGRVTVPVLWDKKTGTIVNNESEEIIRIFNSAFDHLGARPGDFYPARHRQEIDLVNERIYHTLNNGVYRCGFATTQEAYDEAFEALFQTMAWLERRLARRRYLVGDQITEADWRLFTTLLRFDPVYYTHFKTNFRRLVDYPNLWDYTRELYQVPGVKETVKMDHIKRHYYQSHPSINPHRIVPGGPTVDFTAPHHRDQRQDARLAIRQQWEERHNEQI